MHEGSIHDFDKWEGDYGLACITVDSGAFSITMSLQEKQQQQEEEYLCLNSHDEEYNITMNVLSELTMSTNIHMYDSVHKAMLDAGANICILTWVMAQALQDLGMQLRLNTTSVGIRTADVNSTLEIYGWIDIGGYIGNMAVVKSAMCSLLSTSVMQRRGMGTNFPDSQSCCSLYNKEDEFMSMLQCPVTHLYYVNLMAFLPKSLSNVAKVTLLGGGCGVLAVQTGVVTVDTFPLVKRKKKPTHDMAFRVWRLHRRLFHTALGTILAMAMAGLLGELDVEPWEIALVRDHQDCYACALAKWNRLSEVPSSGLHQLIAGSEWSGDIEGIYATKAIGGYCYKATFVELTTGYGCVFLLKFKTEMMKCIRQVARYCNKHGHRMVRFFVDAGTVENGQALQDKCASINGVDS